MSHTPGPWKVAGPVGAAIWVTDESSNNQIAMVYGVDQTPGAKYNARLIAAAPELLEALQVLLPILEDEHECLERSYLPEPNAEEAEQLERVANAVLAARTVIAKAEGRA